MPSMKTIFVVVIALVVGAYLGKNYPQWAFGLL